MEKGKIVVLEGTSNTGKTSTCKILERHKNCIIIPEAADWMSESPKSSRSYEEEIRNQKLFFEMEKRRMEYAKEMINSGKNVIMDRSALSTVAIAYANERCGKYLTYDYALGEYKKMLEDKEFVRPDMYIFLYTSEKERQERNLNRDKKLSESWLNTEFIRYQNEFYSLISKKIKNKLEMDTTDKEQNYVSDYIMELIKEKDNCINKHLAKVQTRKEKSQEER